MVVLHTFLLFSLTQLVPGILTQSGPGIVDPAIHTSVGLINGFGDLVNFNGRHRPVLKFLGIPYAVPPVGNLRFRKPKPAPRFKQPFNATQFGPGCLQNKFLMSLWLPGRDLLSEDCLTLNIFVPIHSWVRGKYPVMLWIHGGAYQIGQSSIYSGENLAYYGSVIVVSFSIQSRVFLE